MRRVSYWVTLAALVCASAVRARAQAPSLTFTVAAPERTTPDTAVRASTVVEERGLALWDGTADDFGVRVDVATGAWSVRATTSMHLLPIGTHASPTFQQIEVVRPIVSRGSLSIAGGGGVRQDWDGSRVLIGRALTGVQVAGGRLQGSLVLERVFSSPVRHDAADIVTSVGWSRRAGDRAALGVEAIGQDLEGFWDRAEADGGAKLLVGPALHVRAKDGSWKGTVTAGRVVTSSPSAGHHLGLFISASHGW